MQSKRASSISVAMTTCNGCPYVGSQLESIASQTRPPDELVVGDDRSSDDTARVLDAFAAARRIPMRWQQNVTRLGHVHNFEQVVRRCRGDIVVFADHDDVWMPHKLARIEAALAGDAADGVFSDGLFIDGRGHPLPGSLFGELSFDAVERAAFASGGALGVLVKRNVVTGATLAVRRTALERLLPFQHSGAHDYYLALALAVLSRVILIDEPLIHYRRHAGQQVGFPERSWHGVVAHVRRQGARESAEEAQNFERLRTRLIGLGVDPLLPALEALRGKARLLGQRAEMRAARRRIPGLVWRSLRDGGYRRYSAGWKQVLLDLTALAVSPVQR